MSDKRIPDMSAVASPPRRDIDFHSLDLNEDPFDAGGQAVVYEAYVHGDAPPDHIALKEPANSGTLGIETVQAFFEEASTWETIDRRERRNPRWEDSEHIVGVIDTGDDLPWIAMEYMDGGSLNDRLAATSDGLPIDEALWIGECVCRGVELAHNYGIAHLDLKPANVLFRETPEGVWNVPKVADWGLARVLAEQTGTVEGLSVQYAAPEQFEPDEFGDSDMLTDVYQVGVLLYALLTGEPPYAGSQASIKHEVVSRDRPSPPSSSLNNLSNEIDTAVMIALETAKTDRYPNIKIFEQALKAVRTDKPLPPIVQKRIDIDDRAVDVDQKTSYNSQEQDVCTDDSSSLPTPSTSVKWPTFQQNTARTGMLSTGSHATNKNEYNGELEMLWSAEIEGEELGNPLVTEDAVYVVARENGFDGALYALDPNSGEESWTLSIQTDHTTPMTPVLKGDTVYVPGNGRIYSIDIRSREINWSHAVRNITSHPTVAERMVYIGGRDGLHAFDLHSGKKEWTLETEYEVNTCPTYHDETVVVGSKYGPLHAVSRSGEHKWAVDFPSGRQHHVTAAAKDGILYTGVRRSYEDDLYAFDIESGNKVWGCKTPDFSGQVDTMPVVTEEQIFVTTNYGGTGELHALDLDTKEFSWKLETDEKLRSPPTITTESVYVSCSDGSLYVCDPKNGEISNMITLSTSEPSGSAPSVGPPIIVGDMLCLRGIENTIFAFRRTE